MFRFHLKRGRTTKHDSQSLIEPYRDFSSPVIVYRGAA